MKRGLVFNFHQSNASRRDPKFNSLLQDYLDLQKENVRKKRKIRSARRKIETLVHEVRFLRQRYEYLIYSRSSKVGEEMVVNENDIGQQAGKGKGKGKGGVDQEWEKTTNCIIDGNKGRASEVTCSAEKSSIHS
ncbi:uncharacterized protein LOC114754478 [Neltuma alba]|uniref:uncharacterized protein LOC114748461 n=1 Tax=Neltuma alba TaxID=207710 RepID=UPI0010A3E995|nr:uncharacterized protein LOC114748461 [Prosopis alba]XP_028799072.1 uncharacterized protein LOC114754478 [Prosopis alba]